MGDISHLNVWQLLNLKCLRSIQVMMSKKVGYMRPELKKAMAGDADLAVFSTRKVVKDHR